MKQDIKKCKSCWGKRFYSVLIGMRASDDFADEGYNELPSIKNVACPLCNKGNKRRIKGVQKTLWGDY